MYMTLLSRGSATRMAHLGQFNGEKRPRYEEYHSKPRIQRAPRPLLCTNTSEVYRMRAIAATHGISSKMVCRGYKNQKKILRTSPENKSRKKPSGGNRTDLPEGDDW